MKALAVGLIGSVLWANEACERHYQAELVKGRSGAQFRIPARQNQPIASPVDAVGSQKIAKVLWGRGFVTQSNGKTTESEFVCLLESDDKAVGVFLRPVEKSAPRLAKR